MDALSQIDICELRTINQKLKILQDKLLSEAIKLDKALHVRVEDKNDVLDDCEIQIKVRFILKEDHPNFKENDDNIVTQIHEYLTNISKDAPSYPWRWNDNHNEYRGWRDHPLRDEHHCWWFHCLYDHNNLEFNDILSIGSMWSDINVYYQYYDTLK